MITLSIKWMRTESILEKLYYSYKIIQETRTEEINFHGTGTGPDRVQVVSGSDSYPTVSSAHIEHTCSSCRSSNYPSYFQKAGFHCTFANIPSWLSPIGEISLYFRQYTLMAFTNWRNSTVLSLTIHWIFAIGESHIGESPSGESPSGESPSGEIQVTPKKSFSFFSIHIYVFLIFYRWLLDWN